MKTRTLTELIEHLNDILEKEGHNYKVYGQPPANVRMIYPCIVIEEDNSKIRHANNKIYKRMKKYTLTVISKDILDTTADDLEYDLEYCKYENSFVTEGLYHKKLNLYF